MTAPEIVRIETPPKSSPVDRRQASLTYSMKDGLFYSIMAGAGESFFSLFAIFLRATPAQIGALAALPQLLGASAQFAAAKLLRVIPNRRALILWPVLLQAATLLPLAILPVAFRDGGGFGFLLAAVIAYYAFGQMANPPWNSLMGDLVDPDQRGQFFGRRSRLLSITTFAALVGAGVILNVAEQRAWAWAGFSLIFGVACVARLVSAYYLTKMHDPAERPAPPPEFELLEFLRRARRSNFTRFILFTGLIHFSVQVSGPFFAPYMLRDLRFSYFEFTAVMATIVLVQFLTMNGWGAFADRFGNKRVLTLTGLLLPIIPWLWLPYQSFWYVLAIQVFGGFVWAGFSLSMGNYLFDTVSAPRRAVCVALYNSANALGTFGGATLGGWLGTQIRDHGPLGLLPFGLDGDLRALFLLSGLLRLAVAIALLRTFREERRVEMLRMRDLVTLAVIRPFSGIRFDLLTGGTGRRKRDRRKFP